MHRPTPRCRSAPASEAGGSQTICISFVSQRLFTSFHIFPLGDFVLKDQEAFLTQKITFFLYKRFKDKDTPRLFENARRRNTPPIR